MNPKSVHIEQRIAQLEALNLQRLNRARLVLTKPGLKVFELIAPLLHFNHPDLPGYVGGSCPAGIQNYQVNTTQREYLAEWEHFRPELVEGGTIQGVYCMGSTASLGQCCDSDLDVWVIFDSDLNIQQRMMLEQKCQKITAWAASLGIEANFFLVDPQQFTFSHQQAITKDNCGSTQNWLLLDEFYRSCICLAGCKLMWFLVPVEDEEQYAEYVLDLTNRQLINPQQWLDLGGIARVPAEEYFGAALWQLYKGIDSPFKAVLKTLLLESYSHQYPKTRLLCHEFKQRWMEGCCDPLGLDSYRLVLEHVSNYLRLQNDMPRLDLARRCFYLKTCMALSQPVDKLNWQVVAMRQLLSDWSWSPDVLTELDSRESWKVEHVRHAYREVLEALMVSFRKLIEFARRNQISEAINPEDIGVLSRKLYASFEMTTSKVELINPNIAPSLYEPVITLVHVPEGRRIAAGWYLYKTPLRASSMIGAKYQKHTDHLSRLIAWAYFNGIINPSTDIQIHAPTTKVSVMTVQRMVRDLSSAMPVKFAPTRKEELSKPSEIRQLMLFVNLKNSKLPEGVEIPFGATSNDIDVFSVGEDQINLVQSVDLLYLSSWNEIHSYHFAGNEAILDCMVMLTSKMHKQANVPMRSDVFCYSQEGELLIGQQVRQVLLDCMTMRLDRTGSGSDYKMFTLADERYALFFERRSVYKHKLENPVDFYRHVSHNKLGGRDHAAGDPVTSMTPTIVENHASEGLVQFFFEQGFEGFNIYVVDEANDVELYEHFKGSKEELVQSVNRFYSSSKQGEDGDDEQVINFNLPQFYEIVERNGSKHILPYGAGGQVSQSINL